MAERLGSQGRVRIVERADNILQNSPTFNQEAARKALSEKKVWIDYETSVAEVSADSLTLSYPDKTETIPVDIVLWTVGNKVSPALDALDLPRNERRQFTIESLRTLTFLRWGIWPLGSMLPGKVCLPQRRLRYSKPTMPHGIFGLASPNDHCYPSAISISGK